jgi:hypothetical protein
VNEKLKTTENLILFPNLNFFANKKLPPLDEKTLEFYVTLTFKVELELICLGQDGVSTTLDLFNHLRT